MINKKSDRDLLEGFTKILGQSAHDRTEEIEVLLRLHRKVAEKKQSLEDWVEYLRLRDRLVVFFAQEKNQDSPTQQKLDELRISKNPSALSEAETQHLLSVVRKKD